MVRLAAAAVLGWALACDAEPRHEAVPGRLVAARTMIKTPGGLVYVFDDDCGPRVCAGRPGRVVAAWSSTSPRSATSTRIDLTCTPELTTGDRRCFACSGRDIPLGDGQLELSGSDPIAAQWRPAPRHIPAIEQARALATATAAVEHLRAAGDVGSPWARVLIASELARQHFRADDRTQGLDASIRTAKLAEAFGVWGIAAQRYRSAAWATMEARQFDAAAGWLLRAEALTPPLAKDQARLAFAKGSLAYRMENFRDAETLLREATRRATEGGRTDDARRYAYVLALTYGMLGRFDDALEVSQSHRPRSDAPANIKAEYEANLADIKHHAMLAGALDMSSAEADAHVRRAIRFYEEANKPDHARACRVEWAWWAVQDDDLPVARARFDAIEPGPFLGPTRWQYGLVAAALLHRAGDAVEADRRLAEIEAALDAERGGQPTELAVHAAVMRAEVAAQQGLWPGAAAHYRRALDEMIRLSARALLRRSAGALLRRLASVRRAAIESWIEVGQPGTAFALADAARTALLLRLRRFKPQERGRVERVRSSGQRLIRRVRRGCEAKATERRRRCVDGIERALSRWSADAMALYASAPHVRTATMATARISLPPSRAIVALEAQGGRWRSLTVDRRGVSTATSASAVGPWLDRVVELEHLYLIADGVDAVNSVIDALPIGRGPSVTSIPAGQWLAWPAAPQTGPPLIVVDAEDNLTVAREEGAWLHRRWPASRLYTSDSLGSLDLGPALRSASIFHFGGHGYLVSADPWSTLLDLGPAGPLSLEDVIIHKPKFALAVLNGCETGTAETTLDTGLPQALLASGTRAVVATVRIVHDGAAAGFVRTFYENDGRRRPARAFRETVDAFRRREDPTWTAFRIWGHVDASE